jgi:alkaline phosphatase
MLLRILTGLIFIIIVMGGCKVADTQSSTYSGPKKAKNIILLIGDGMGLAQLSASYYTSNKPLTLTNMPYIGFHMPHSSDDLITDSAAGATAFACGVETYNGAIGVDKDTVACRSILSELESLGYATGLIATSTIVHATPASFVAHRPMRVQYEEIAEDFLKEEIDLIIGGGKRYFDRRDKDERQLTEELRKRNYFISDYLIEELSLIVPPVNQNFAYFAADKHPLTKSAGRDYLPFSTRMATNFLKKRSDHGFFLMVEGSQIDWGGHSNDAGLIIDETLDFDEAVKEAIRFAKKDGNTLVIVTADHECGGMAINPGSTAEKINAAFTTNGHTATLVPVFAFGPSAQLFTGIYKNTDIYHKMRAALQLDALSSVKR